MDTFNILSPDGHPLFVADLPNERGSGNPHHQYVRSEQELQRFIAARDKPGRALYYTVAHLAEGAGAARKMLSPAIGYGRKWTSRTTLASAPRKFSAASTRRRGGQIDHVLRPRLPRFLAVLRANRRASGRCTATA